MKKVGLLILVLVIALGALGVGYAKWSDTVTVSGTISTGSVSIGIKDAGVGDTGADPDFAPGVNSEGKNVASHVSTNGSQIGTTGWYENITETISNAYPWYASSTTIEIMNLGTIPVKIDDVRMPTTSFEDPDNLMAFMQIDSFTLTYKDELNVTHTVTGDSYEDLAAYDSLQIPAQSFATLVIDFHFNEDVNIDSDSDLEQMPMNATLSFDIVITASQWNEV